MDQRKYARLQFADMDVDIADKVGFSTGTLKDISRFGACITDIPRKLHTKDNFFTVVITGGGHRFKLKVRPRWERKDGLTMSTGISIDDVPWPWTEMIMRLEPRSDDVWAGSQ